MNKSPFLKFFVEGGVHVDTTFKAVKNGTEEHYGPFATYEEARKAWWIGTCKNVDICEHRLFIRMSGR